MVLPIYVVTGFLDAGKTTFLNNLLNREDWRDIRKLVIQFENGEEELQTPHEGCYAIAFAKKAMEQQSEQIAEQIHSCIHSREFDEIWIEWNGVVPFSQLQSLILHPLLRGLCKIKKVIHIVDAANIENLLGRTGGALPEQIASSDLAVLRGVRSADAYKRIRRLLNGINPGVDICEIKEYKDLYKQLFGRKERRINFLFLAVVFIVVFSLFFRTLFTAILQAPVNMLVNIFLGLILQAVPFLLIGVLISSAIQVFIPQSAIERRFPKSIAKGIPVAIVGGFCLPVCDCASIPIFRSLVKKGIPLPVAVTFMTATPVINPVVILSTYYAFSGNWAIVASRVCLGIAAAVIIGLVFAARPPKGHILSGGALDRLMCSCGCYEDVEAVTTLKGKAGLFIRHSQAEFFSVGKYLVIGTFIASVFQVLGTGIFTAAAQNSVNLAFSTVIMMVMGFVLSLCSSSDAVVARSFVRQFPMGAVMGFLVFGPMMDIKNVMMLSAGFSKRFIARLLFTAFIVCFFTVFLFFALGGYRL